MKHLLTFILVSVISIVIYASVDWKSIDLSLPTLSGVKKDTTVSFTDDDDAENENKLWIDTVMYAQGHAFGYSGDITMWDGWYLDTIFLGDERMLRFDSAGPSVLKLSLITREVLVDLGDKDVVDRIRKFINPINGFQRFQQNYEECLDSVIDEEYRTWKYMGEFSFTVDHPDSNTVYADKINRFICKLTGISENERANVPVLSAFYAGFNQTKNYRPVYTGNANDMKCLSDFLAYKTFENWMREGDFCLGSSAYTLAIKPHVANERYVTLSVYEYDRVGIGHGMYTETFHTFDLKNEKELTNNDIFKGKYLDKVKMALFEVMANDSHYRAWNGDTISPSDIQRRIEGWQSPNPILEGTEWEEPEKDVHFELPDGALTDTGVVFSFQPYEIDCWAAGAYHFIVPYKKLLPYMTPKARRLIDI